MPRKKEVVLKILEARPNLSRETIEQMIKQKKEKVGRLLTDEGAAYMVANELDIDLSGERVIKTSITIREIPIGASNITITGKVLAVNKARSFHRNDGSEGKVARIALGDKTGVVNTVLWDEKAEITDKQISKGDLVRINNAYVRVDRNGKPELNVGRRGSVTVLSQILSPNTAFIVKEIYKKIRDLREREAINFIGVIERISAIITFQKADGQEGKLIRIRLIDETGSIIAIFWDEKTDTINKAHRGDCIKIMNAYVKRGLGDHLEIHVNREADVTFQEKPNEIYLPPITFCKIDTLTPKMFDVDVLARVTNLGKVREFVRPSGQTGKVGDLFLTDETGVIRLSLWDEKAEILKTISCGDIVLVEGAYTREGLGGLSLNLGKSGSLKVNPNIEKVKDISDPSTELAS